MKIDGSPIFISASCTFDGSDYSLIRIGDSTVVSSNVSFLTHDYSISRARDALQGVHIRPEIAILKPVSVGANSFIGRSALLLPGTEIGDDCIVGAGSVVRGKVPNGSIVVGNPAEVVGKTLEWGQRTLDAIES